MNDHKCEVWISYFERSEIGEALDSKENAFLESHRISCGRCAAEWNALHSLALPKVLPVDSHDVRAIERALATTAQLPRRNTRTSVVAGIVALAAAALLTVGYFVTMPRPFFVLAGKQGLVTVNGRDRAVGSPVAVGEKVVVKEGRACLSVATGGQLCLESETEAAPFVDTGAERTLHLIRGAVEVRMDHQPQGIRVGVHTDEGDVLAIGTVFRVIRNEAVEVQVTEGRVLTRSAFREEELRPGAPRTLRASGLANAVPSPAPTRAQADIVNVSNGQEARPSQKTEALIDAPINDPHGSVQASVDNTPPPRVRNARHGVSPNPSANEDKRPSGPQVNQAKRLAPRNAESEPKESDGPQLLREARQLRARGRDAEAARLLERLIAEHGRSEEAHAALLTLTDLELTSLKQPERALLHSRQYLSGSGELRDEAAFRELRALEALRRSAEAERARERFLLEFPQSPHVGAVRESKIVNP